MKNRELKPGYNLQVASNSQYILGFDIFANPTDTRTLLPFLSSFPTMDLFQPAFPDCVTRVAVNLEISGFYPCYKY